MLYFKSFQKVIIIINEINKSYNLFNHQLIKIYNINFFKIKMCYILTIVKYINL